MVGNLVVRALLLFRPNGVVMSRGYGMPRPNSRRGFPNAVVAVLGLSILASGGCTVDAPPPGPDGLLYEYPTHATALDEDVMIVKTSLREFVRRADGREQARVAFDLEEAFTWRTRFGAVDPLFLRRVGDSPAAAVFLVQFHFTIDADWASLSPRLASLETEVRAAAQEELTTAIRASGARARSTLADAGVDVLVAYDTIPIVFGRASGSTIRRLWQHPSLTYIGSPTVRARFPQRP